ncbi:MAG: 16S rRNA (cytidine(1402)-2'-O)-methyltransferase [Paracoccaceae bacterium]
MNSKPKTDNDTTGRELRPGLYLVATPIGSARDITLRALDVLSTADVIAAEDTRRARKLLDIHGISVRGRPILPYHDHNGPQQRPRLLRYIEEGKSVACVSDAGTPLVADPGYRLAEEAISRGLHVTSAPGPSALLAAISVSGLPSDRFLFAGFPPVKSRARMKFLRDLAGIHATLVLFEAPRRLAATLSAMADALGAGRRVALCRELTKRFEEVRRGTLAGLAREVSGEATAKGELVIVIGPPEAGEPQAEDIDAALRDALRTLSVKDSATAVAETFGVPRKEAYRRALEIEEGK